MRVYNLIQDAAFISSRKISGLSKDVNQKLIAPRREFVQIGPEKPALNRIGQKINGLVRRYVHPRTGIEEIVLNTDSYVKRLMIENDKPVGAIIFNRVKDEFVGNVFEKGANDELIHLTNSGKNFEILDTGSFSSSFSIKDFQ